MTRWRCRNDRCERRIFAERIPGLAAPFARRSAKDPKNRRAIIWRIVERGDNRHSRASTMRLPGDRAAQKGDLNGRRSVTAGRTVRAAELAP